MKFFREPHLGSYLALDLNYETSMSYNSLVSAIDCTKKYEEAKSKQEEIQNNIKNKMYINPGALGCPR